MGILFVDLMLKLTKVIGPFGVEIIENASYILLHFVYVIEIVLLLYL